MYSSIPTSMTKNASCKSYYNGILKKEIERGMTPS